MPNWVKGSEILSGGIMFCFGLFPKAEVAKRCGGGRVGWVDWVWKGTELGSWQTGTAGVLLGVKGIPLTLC